jgi:hypothetical protein
MITPEQKSVIEANKPNAYTSFVYKAFLNDKFKDVVKYSLLSMFIIGFILVAVGEKKACLFITLVYSCTLTLEFLITFPAFIMNSIRLKRIRNKLGVSATDLDTIMEEYQAVNK